MTAAVVIGLVLGALGAYYAHAGGRKFRNKLLQDLEHHRRKRTLETYVTDILDNQDKWKRSMALIRKPFGKQVNLAVETAGTLMALVGLVNGLANFEQIFDSTPKGVFVITFLAMVLAFIPSQWFFSGRMEKDMDSVLQEMREAQDRGELRAFVSRASKAWKP